MCCLQNGGITIYAVALNKHQLDLGYLYTFELPSEVMKLCNKTHETHDTNTFV